MDKVEPDETEIADVVEVEDNSGACCEVRSGVDI